MSATGGILPTYQRFVNGVPVPTFSRRSFRPREKYLIFLVFLTFGLVCFGTFFFLPEFRGSNSTVDSVYKVYQHMQKAGPELLIPAPPHLSDSSDTLKLIRHDDEKVDPHVIDDRAKLLAKIEQDAELKVLERPNMDLNIKNKPSSTSTASKPAEEVQEGGENNAAGGLVPQVAPIVTVPPAHSDHYPDVNRGEDPDPVARERRAKVKEVSCVNEQSNPHSLTVIALHFHLVQWYKSDRVHTCMYILCIYSHAHTVQNI